MKYLGIDLGASSLGWAIVDFGGINKQGEVIFDKRGRQERCLGFDLGAHSLGWAISESGKITKHGVVFFNGQGEE